tara:strand:+ start:2586 stop:4082 length:1497 start_codon:yes stop_codon:yes gene_type:complete
MITTAIFQKNPVSSSPLRGGGKKFTITSETTNIDGNTHRWYMIWVVPEKDGILDYGNATIQIYMSTQTYYEYDTEGVTQLQRLPQGLKDRIVSDFNTLTTVTEKPVHEDDREEDSSTIVRSETVYGSTITMTREVVLGNVRYRIHTTLDNYSTTKTSQEDAEIAFDYQVSRANLMDDSGSIIDYNGVTIDFDTMRFNDGTESGNVDSVALFGEGFPREEFIIGDELIYNDGYGSRNFGIITLDESVDTPMLKEYIDAKTTVREDPNPFVLTGSLEVQSFGWYNNDANADSLHNPFSKVIMNEVFTLSNTDGRILGITDSDGFSDSGNLLLRVKDGYRVRLKLMTQRSNYFKDNITNMDSIITHTQYEKDLVGSFTSFDGDNFNYVDTDQITFDMFGGDTLQVDIDDEYSETLTFSITSSGQQIVGGAPPKIDDETFLAIIEVEKDALQPSNNGGGSQGPPDTNGDDTDTSKGVGNGIAIVVVSILIIGILWMVLRDGE